MFSRLLNKNHSKTTLSLQTRLNQFHDDVGMHTLIPVVEALESAIDGLTRSKACELLATLDADLNEAADRLSLSLYDSAKPEAQRNLVSSSLESLSELMLRIYASALKRPRLNAKDTSSVMTYAGYVANLLRWHGRDYTLKSFRGATAKRMSYQRVQSICLSAMVCDGLSHDSVLNLIRRDNALSQEVRYLCLQSVSLHRKFSGHYALVADRISRLLSQYIDAGSADSIRDAQTVMLAQAYMSHPGSIDGRNDLLEFNLHRPIRTLETLATTITQTQIAPRSLDPSQLVDTNDVMAVIQILLATWRGRKVPGLFSKAANDAVIEAKSDAQPAEHFVTDTNEGGSMLVIGADAVSAMLTHKLLDPEIKIENGIKGFFNVDIQISKDQFPRQDDETFVARIKVPIDQVKVGMLVSIMQEGLSFWQPGIITEARGAFLNETSIRVRLIAPRLEAVFLEEDESAPAAHARNVMVFIDTNQQVCACLLQADQLRAGKTYIARHDDGRQWRFLVRNHVSETDGFFVNHCFPAGSVGLQRIA